MIIIIIHNELINCTLDMLVVKGFRDTLVQSCLLNLFRTFVPQTDTGKAFSVVNWD